MKIVKKVIHAHNATKIAMPQRETSKKNKKNSWRWWRKHRRNTTYLQLLPQPQLEPQLHPEPQPDMVYWQIMYVYGLKKVEKDRWKSSAQIRSDQRKGWMEAEASIAMAWLYIDRPGTSLPRRHLPRHAQCHVAHPKSWPRSMPRRHPVPRHPLTLSYHAT